MGRHSRKEPAPAQGPGHPEPADRAGSRTAAAPAGRTAPAAAPAAWPERAAVPRGFVPPPRHEQPAPARGGHPEQREPGGAWGAGPGFAPRTAGAPAAPAAAAPSAATASAVYGDWRGMPGARSAAAPAAPAAPAPAPVRDGDTPAFGTPAVGFPQVTLDSPLTSTGSHRRISAPGAEDAFTASGPHPRVSVHAAEGAVTSTGAHRRITLGAPVREPLREPAPGARDAFAAPGSEDAFTSTGSHRRVPPPRTPAAPAPAPAPAPEPAGSAPGRGLKVRTYTGMAAAAVTTVLAVVVAGQVASEGDDGKAGVRAAAEGSGRHSVQGNSAASRSDDRPTPAAPGAAQAAPEVAPELSYEQKMAQQLPIDEKLKGPGTFETVPGVAPAPGKGKLVRYRVDVETGLGLDPQLFAEAIHRTLNDDRSWGHGGSKTFERVPGGEADFVITLASPGTTGVWCRKSGLDTTVDNVSCDSASTDRVMINAFRWAQGSASYGADQMFAYRQMLINHEVGHRLGHGHVNCSTPGAPAPIMQQQTKSLDIGGIQCKANPWVYPAS
ncbi:hypothetical protein SAVIM338S_04851 [Streptomyces avidinii]